MKNLQSSIYEEPTKEELEKQNSEIEKRLNILEQYAKDEHIFRRLSWWTFRIGTLLFTILIIIRVLIFMIKGIF